MPDPLELPVSLYGQQIGELLREGRGALFRWAPAESLPWPLLSPVLSKNLRVGFSGIEQTESFFGGLLPEGSHLGNLARQAQVSREDIVGLLNAVGADVAGALTVGEHRHRGEPELLGTEEVAQLTADARGFLVGGGGSALPGFQRKLTLTRLDGRWLRGNGAVPSTHILKPVPAEDRSAAEAELYVLSLARALDLLHFEAWTEDFGRLTALVVERYDRRRTHSGEIERLHQEDMGQAIGLPWGGAEKFEVNDDRSNLRSMAALLDEDRTIFATAHPEKEKLLRYVTLNVAAGNTDAHAKNFSLIHEPDGKTSLAPYYDSAPLALAYGARTDMAMRVNGVSQLPEVTSEDLVAEASSWGIEPSTARSIVDSTLDQIIEATRAVPVHDSIASHVPGYVRGQAQNLIEGRRARITSAIPLSLLPHVGTPQDRTETAGSA